MTNNNKWSKQFDIRPHCRRRRTVHEGTLTPPGEYDWIYASFGPSEPTTQKSIGSAIFAQLTGQCRYGRPFPMGVWTPSNTWFLGPSEPTTQTGSRSFQPFLHRWPKSEVTEEMLYSGTSPSKLPLPMQDLDAYLIHDWFLGHTRVLNQTASRSVQRFLQGSLVWRTDRQTDNATRSVTRLHLRT